VSSMNAWLFDCLLFLYGCPLASRVTMIKPFLIARIDMIFGTVWQISLELCKIGT